jgi:hypothetical protein
MAFPASPSLPPIGLEIPCSCHASNVPFQVNVLGVIPLDFKGGWRVRVEENIASELGGVRLRVIGCEWVAESEALGTVTISQDGNVDTTPLSLLEIIGNSPVFRNTMYLDFTVTVEKPTPDSGPLVLANTRTVTIVHDNLKNFPPQEDVYQLQEPVGLAPVNAPGQVVVQLLQFPLTVTYSA